MRSYEFTLVAKLNREFDAFAGALFAAGCDDATISLQRGLAILDFERDAKSFGHALKSAMDDVARAGVECLRIEPDSLVSISDIAARAGFTRAAASNYAKGARGKAFPSPVMRVTSESPLWDWVDVARWLFRQGKLPLAELVRARIVKRENEALRGGQRAAAA